MKTSCTGRGTRFRTWTIHDNVVRLKSTPGLKALMKLLSRQDPFSGYSGLDNMSMLRLSSMLIWRRSASLLDSLYLQGISCVLDQISRAQKARPTAFTPDRRPKEQCNFSSVIFRNAPFLMKIRFARIIPLICVAAIFQACSSDDSSSRTESFEVSLRVNQCHTHSLGTFGDEEGASLTQVPRRADSSFLRRESGETMTYKYCPTRQFVGTDEVEITSTRLTDPQTTVTTITYTISK